MSNEKSVHWESVYQTKDSTGVSWFRPHLDVSLKLLRQAGVTPHSRIVDIGAGASTLVDDLLNLGVQHITALDLSSESLAITQRRLGERASSVTWIVADATQHPFGANATDLWHDRAVLHFLVDPNEAAAYVRNAERAIARGGHAVIGCFASDGPKKCSGLPVVRRDPGDIAALFGPAFKLISSAREQHATPFGTTQSFAYALLQKFS